MTRENTIVCNVHFAVITSLTSQWVRLVVRQL